MTIKPQQSMKNKSRILVSLNNNSKPYRFLLLSLFLASCVGINENKKNQFFTRYLHKKVFYEDIVPIINSKCMNCHSSDRTLINFSDYESIYGRRAMIKYVIENDLMPPWSIAKHTGPWKNDLSLSLSEKQLILNWFRVGLPYRKKILL